MNGKWFTAVLLLGLCAGLFQFQFREIESTQSVQERQESPNSEQFPLLGTTWSMYYAGTSRISDTEVITMNLQVNTLTGTFCGAYSGRPTYSLSGITITSLASEETQCGDTVTTNYRSEFFKMIQGGASIAQDEDLLELKSETGSTFLFKAQQ